MAILSTLGVGTLTLRGAGDTYHRLSGIFASEAEANAAVSGGTLTITPGVINAVLIQGKGLSVWDGSSAFVSVNYNKTEVDAAIATAIGNLTDSAPGVLDTLNELAAAIGDDPAFFTTMATANAAIQADVDANEAAADAAIALRATIDNPTFTTKIASPEFHSAGSHLKFKADTNDIIFYPNNTETLQITRHSGTGHPTFTANGGSGEFKFNQIADLAGGVKLAGTTVTATAAELNFVDGVTSNIQTQIDAVQADVNQNETDADAGIAAANVAMLAAVAAVQADVDTNESDADTAIALKANIDAPTFTGTSTFSGGGTLAVDASDSANFELNKSGTAGLIKLGTRMVSSQKQEIGTPSFDTTLKGQICMSGSTSEYKIQSANRIYVEATDIVLDNGGVVKVSDNNAAALDIKEGSNSLLKVDTTNSSENVEIGTSLSVAGDTTLTGERLVFSNNAALIRLKDNQAAALTIENQDASADEFVVFNTQNAGLSLTTKQAHQHDNTLTVGVDDTGYDVKLFGDTASAYALWDASADDLILAGGAGLVVPEGQFTLGSTAVTSTAAELNYVDGVTSNVQTQLDAKAALAGATFTGAVVQTPAASVTPGSNGELMVEATNNTTLTFKLKGSDGTVRSGTITLS
mgnify:CR=1 FL=1